MHDKEHNISLVGKSGKEYYGRVYYDKTGATSLTGTAIVCLSNSQWEDNHWQHAVRDIYNDDAADAFNHFIQRDDISHLILLHADQGQDGSVDIIDDLRRQYIHQGKDSNNVSIGNN